MALSTSDGACRQQATTAASCHVDSRRRSQSCHVTLPCTTHTGKDLPTSLLIAIHTLQTAYWLLRFATQCLLERVVQQWLHVGIADQHRHPFFVPRDPKPCIFFPGRGAKPVRTKCVASPHVLTDHTQSLARCILHSVVSILPLRGS